MSSEPPKWLFDITGGRHECKKIREFSVAVVFGIGDLLGRKVGQVTTHAQSKWRTVLFSLTFKKIFWPCYGGGAIDPYGSATTSTATPSLAACLTIQLASRLRPSLASSQPLQASSLRSVQLASFVAATQGSVESHGLHAHCNPCCRVNVL